MVAVLFCIISLVYDFADTFYVSVNTSSKKNDRIQGDTCETINYTTTNIFYREMYSNEIPNFINYFKTKLNIWKYVRTSDLQSKFEALPYWYVKLPNIVVINGNKVSSTFKNTYFC